MIQSDFGGPEVISLRRVPDPVPSPHGVVIKVAGCTLSTLDELQLAGPAVLPGFRLPHIAGSAIGGAVTAVGSDVTSFRPGDQVIVDPAVVCGHCPECTFGRPGYCASLRVVGGNSPGGFAELVEVPRSAVHRIPGKVSLDDAITLPAAWAIAWHATYCVANVQAGEWVVVPGAAGSVGMAILQLANRAGAHVVALASSSTKRAFAAALGAALVLDPTEDVPDQVRNATDGRGVDVVLDPVGAQAWRGSMDSLRLGGRIVVLGNIGGDFVTVSLAGIFHRGIHILGAGAYCRLDFSQMVAAFAQGGMQAAHATSYTLTDLPAAYAAHHSRDRIGAIVVRP